MNYVKYMVNIIETDLFFEILNRITELNFEKYTTTTNGNDVEMGKFSNYFYALRQPGKRYALSIFHYRIEVAEDEKLFVSVGSYKPVNYNENSDARFTTMYIRIPFKEV